MLQLFFGETELRAALPIYFPQELMGIEIWKAYVPGSKLPILGMVIPSLIGNPYNGYINPSYWVDEHPLFKGSLDEKLPIYEQDPKSKRLDSFEKRLVRD